ncbi:MAG: MBOAT family O-acyltransferase [Melioribacteraceae bacterium]|nr:MBOAT family protein [Melioribacteraceae bacterium]WKZ69213.1 MAG: MBOAT family O-acyltransferase [Melioribacteraceae bacterium]
MFESDLFQNIIELLSYDPFRPLLFNSGFFLFFFIFILIFYRFFWRNKRAKVFFLTVMSLYFYYKSSGLFFYLVILSSIIDFIAAKYIYAVESGSKKKLYLILSLITNLGILGYFKYTNFFINTVNSISTGSIEFVDIFLPVGVSFFTFQSMSYTIDIYKGNLEPENNFIDFLFFVSFFPQLVAGPIVRAKDFLPQIKEDVFVTKEEIGRALFLIIAGLLKKAVIADYISINFIDRVFEWPTRFTGVENLLAVYGYLIQIYCDFSGYSDMAIGLALLLGFKLPMNFNAPYKAKTITEFWQRWHISLSTWLRDYLYISLGGNRKGNTRTYINLMLTMLLGGLWHGASWRFVIWGAWHGLALAVERFFNLPKWISKQNIIIKILSVFITLHVWALSMIFFRVQEYNTGFEMLNQIIHYFHFEVLFQFIEGYTLVFILIVIGYVSHYIPEKWEDAIQKIITNLPLIGKAILITIVIWLVAQFKASDIQPFIYFQF